MRKKLNLLGVIITKNEEVHIRRCIESLGSYVDNILVVDAFSDDKTIDIAKSLGAKVIQRRWKSYPDQLNWLLAHHTEGYDFVFRLDADEYIGDYTPERFRSVLSGLLAKGKHIVSVKRSYNFLGSILKDSQMYRKNVARVFTPNHRFANRPMDEKLVFNDLEHSVVDLEIIDDNLKGVSSWILKHTVYSSLEARNYISKGPMSKFQNVYYTLPVFTRSALYFLFRLVITQRFRGGIPAIIYTTGQALIYRIMVDFHISETLRPSALELQVCEKNNMEPVVIRAIEFFNELHESVSTVGKAANSIKCLKLNRAFIGVHHYLPVRLRFLLNLMLIVVSTLFSFFYIKRYKKFIILNSIFLLIIDMLTLERKIIKNNLHIIQ